MFPSRRFSTFRLSEIEACNLGLDRGHLKVECTDQEVDPTSQEVEGTIHNVGEDKHVESSRRPAIHNARNKVADALSKNTSIPLEILLRGQKELQSFMNLVLQGSWTELQAFTSIGSGISLALLKALLEARMGL